MAEGMVVPVAGVTLGQIANTFGAPRSGGRSHAGIDIFAATGTPVLAASGGRVVKAVRTNSGLGGLRVTVLGDDGRYYYYAHLNRVDVGVGARVSAGQRLGGVGTSGNARGTPPHLHFSVGRNRADDGAFNAYQILSGAGAQSRAAPVTGAQLLAGSGDEPAEPDMRAVDEIIMEDFGHLAWAVTHPELGPIVRQAAEEGWTESTLRGAVHATQWWATNAETAREWQRIRAEDPAEADRQVQQMAATISDLAATLGLTLTTRKVTEIAEEALQFGWSEVEVNDALTAELRWNPAARFNGRIGAAIETVGQTAADFMVDLGDEPTFDYARQLLAGELDIEGVETLLRGYAKERFPHLQSAFDRGLTAAEYFAPYAETAARLLEVPAGQIDLRNDPELSRVLDPIVGGDRPEMMSLGQFERMVRETEGWQSTRQAQQGAAELGESLLQTFGAVR